MRTARGLRPCFLTLTLSLSPQRLRSPCWATALRAAGIVSAVAALLTALLSAEAAASTVRVPRQFFGLHDKSGQVYSQLAFGSLRLWDANVTWREIETSPGIYDWTRLDAYVTAAQARGVEVTLVVGMTPSFYNRDRTKPPAELSAYRSYVSAAMARYRDFNGKRGIAAYQVWNEGNVRDYWTGTPNQLAQLTQVVAQTRRLVDPGAVVLAPSFAVRQASQRAWLAHYQSQRVGGRPVWRYYDANALSLYPRERYGARLGGPEESMQLLHQVRRLLTQVGVPSKPIWGTEINYGLNGHATAATPISERRQVANVIRTYVLAAANRLARMFWYRYDWASLAGGGTIGNTLLSTPGDPRNVTGAGRALETVEQWLHGTLVGPGGRAPCQRDRRATYTCVVRYARGVRTILWNPLRRVRVPLPRKAHYRQAGDGAPVTLSRGTRRLRVSYLPIMVESAR
jgi:hypothetical protein